MTGIDHTGHDFFYTIAGAVDASGTLADGRAFRDIRDLKALLAANPRQLARNFPHQLTVYSTGTRVHFSGRADIESILDACSANQYRARGHPGQEAILQEVRSHALDRATGLRV